MARKKNPGYRPHENGDRSGGGSGSGWAFIDPPVGLGARRAQSFATYTAADLAAGRLDAESVTQSPQEHQIGRGLMTANVRIVRPLIDAAPGTLDLLSRTRAHVSAILSRNGVQVRSLPEEELAGAVMLSTATMQYAVTHSPRLQQTPAEELLEAIRANQPSTYTQDITSKSRIMFLGGNHERRVSIGLRLLGSDIQHEEERMIQAVRDKSGGEVAVRGNAVLMLGAAASASIARPAQEALIQGIQPAVSELGEMHFAPSPALVSAAPQA